jgi:hypothetical protein
MQIVRFPSPVGAENVPFQDSLLQRQGVRDPGMGFTPTAVGVYLPVSTVCWKSRQMQWVEIAGGAVADW